MTCEKCCFWPCNATNDTCGKGVYWKRDEKGNLIKMIVMPPLLAKVVEGAILKVLASEST